MFQYIRSLKNFATEQPYQHAVYYLAVLLTEHAWTKQELLAATERMFCTTISFFGYIYFYLHFRTYNRELGIVYSSNVI